MNKRRTVILLFVLFPYSIKGLQVASTYRNENYRFVLSIPEGWEQIDLQGIAPGKPETTKKLNQLSLQFEAAFQRKSNGQFIEYPYLFVQVHNGSTTLDEFKKEIVKQNQILKEKGETYLKIPDAPIIDRKKKCIIVHPDFSAPEVPDFKTLMVFFPGKSNIVQLNFCTDQYERDKTEIEFIISTFGFFKGAEYVEGNGAYELIIKIAAALLFVLLWALWTKSKKKKPSNPKGGTGDGL